MKFSKMEIIKINLIPCQANNAQINELIYLIIDLAIQDKQVDVI